MIKTIIRILLQNPVNYWLLWGLNVLKNKTKFRTAKLDYLATSKNSKLGKNVYIGPYSKIQNSEIGDYSYVSTNSRIGNAVFGKFCSVSSNVTMGRGIHPVSEFVSTHPIFYSNDNPCLIEKFSGKTTFTEFKPITIGNDVLIGTHAVILDGITIGDGAIIGAGAVVTKDVEPYSIVGGIPAKHIRYRFAQEEIKFLLDFQWWNKDTEYLKRFLPEFSKIESFRQRVQS